MLKLRKFHLHKDTSDASPKRCKDPEERAACRAKRREKRRRFVRRFLAPAAGLLLMCAFLLGVLVLTVSAGMKAAVGDRVRSADELAVLASEAPFDCILVLGAGLRADGSPSDMLHDRVSVGTQLYHQTERTPLLMSGDHTGSYNEVAAMKDLAISLGADSTDIFLDHAGYSTYESILRAKEIFGARRVLIVTQEYHLYRALYIAESLGLEAYGISADLRAYRGQTKYELRETLARFKDLFTGARLEHTTFDEPPVSLLGNGDET